MKNAEDLKYLEALNHKRTIRFDYRGLEVELQGTSLAEELVLKLACWVKAHAVGTDALPEMKFEIGLIQDMTTNTKPRSCQWTATWWQSMLLRGRP